MFKQHKINKINEQLLENRIHLKRRQDQLKNCKDENSEFADLLRRVILLRLDRKARLMARKSVYVA